MTLSSYNRAMLRCLRYLAVSVLSSLIAMGSAGAWGQSAAKGLPKSAQGETQRATALAENRHCPQSFPLLKRLIHQATNPEMKKRIGLDGLHCAMTPNVPYESLDFLAVMSHDFPRDPEVLYAAAHAYSDSSLRASQDLAHQAPFSYRVRELNAEALEQQGKWDEAAEYGKILDLNPQLPGIHARLGRALLSQSQPAAEAVEQAKRSFDQERDIDPRNAVAEYVLGQLAQDRNDAAGAISHFARAAKIDSGFGEAFLGLGTSLVSAKRFTEAIPPFGKLREDCS